MTAVTRRALRVYSALSELRESKGDILDALIPFFEPILEAFNEKLFEPAGFAAAVQKVLRWRFNADIAENFRQRLVRKGYLKRPDAKREEYFVTYSPPDEVKTNSLPIADALERIIDEFQEFPPQVTELLNYERTREQLTDILIRFLVSLDAYAESDFLAELERLKLKEDTKTALAQLEEGGTPLARDDRYMCARFVIEISKRLPDYVPYLSRLASIGLLTEVVDDFIKPTQVEAKSNLIIVLDAPIALDLLGCSGRSMKDDLKRMSDALREIGCSFVVFPITCEEMSRNLLSMLKLSPNRRHGPTHATICKGEILEEYVKMIARDPVTALKRAGIQLRPLDLDQLPNSHKFFDKKRYEDFFDEVRWLEDVAPRDHDATCMTLVMRLRGGQHHSDLLRCGHVFMTRNPEFVERSRAYCLKSRLINEIQQGPVVHQRELFTIAWLRTGLDPEERIPRGHLLAVCDRVLQTRAEVRDAVANKLKQIRPEDLEQYEALLADQRCLQVLADQTLNDEKVVTAQNVTKLLDIMKKSTASEMRQEYEQKLAEARRQLQELQEQVAQLTREREQETSITKADKDSQPHHEITSILKRRKRDLMGSTSSVRSRYKP